MSPVLFSLLRLSLPRVLHYPITRVHGLDRVIFKGGLVGSSIYTSPHRSPRVPSAHTAHDGQFGKVDNREDEARCDFEIWTFPNSLVSRPWNTLCLCREYPSPLFAQSFLVTP